MGGGRVGGRGGRRGRESLGRPPPGVAAWTRVVARMGLEVPEVRRRSTPWSPSPRSCCRTAVGLCRA